MHFEVPVMMENTIWWFENNIGNEKRADLVFEENGEVVAFGGLTSINRETNKAELYIFVKPEVLMECVGTRATKELCTFAFAELGLDKVYQETNEDNLAAQHVYEKCGFMLEGKLRNEYRAKEEKMMCRMYCGLLKSELNG